MKRLTIARYPKQEIGEWLQEMADIAQDQGMHPDKINAVCDAFPNSILIEKRKAQPQIPTVNQWPSIQEQEDYWKQGRLENGWLSLEEQQAFWIQNAHTRNVNNETGGCCENCDEIDRRILEKQD